MNNLADMIPRTLADIVRHRARTTPDALAYTFLADGAADARSLTWADLHSRSHALATALSAQGASGQPVLLLLPSGLEFVHSLFACWYAGAIAVPVSLPRHQRVKHRLDRIIADAQAHHAIATSETRRRLEEAGEDEPILRGITAWIDPLPTQESPAKTDNVLAKEEDPALLQYTSGSTGDPRGVVVTHKNLMQNSAQIAEACGHQPGQTIAGWLPLFHDMGLIGLVIQSAYSGARCVFMSPERFLMRPWLWLKMISDYGAASSPAPNFAYELCAEKVTAEQKQQLNLRGWRNALNGSEPVRAGTLDRFSAAFACCGFRPEALFPCYGLAESTLFVTGPRASRRLTRRDANGMPLRPEQPGGHVGCGSAFGDTQIAIVDPATKRRIAPGKGGEIWVAGESCAQGYWNNPEATAATFDAQLHGEDPDPRPSSWLRTGDLGFISDGELFITGRLRELIILSGKNFFPIDLERTAEAADPMLAASGAVAFSHDTERTERLIIAAEVRREWTNAPAPETTIDAIRRSICAAIAAEHDVVPHEVLLLRPGALPRTTSGKVSRRAAQDGYLNQTLKRLQETSHVHANC